jgi:Na+-transporting methylmalonyl-CoA/oxaloacetate decarboxylase gamma subunit
MIVFAVLAILIITAIACVSLVCAQFDADDLRNMGIRL